MPQIALQNRHRFARNIGLHPYERRASCSAFCLLPSSFFILHSSFMWLPPYRPHTATIPPGLLQSAPGRTKEEGGMKNTESRGRYARPCVRIMHGREPPTAPRSYSACTRVPRCLCSGIGIYTSREMPDCGAFPPLLLTQEGGEGRGEEARFVEPPLSSSLPTRSSWGERELV